MNELKSCGLRLAEFDVLVGINLLREGLDLPEVSLVAILDADKEGFLRNERSLMQTAGRAARNVLGKVLLYADRVTPSMQKVIDETGRRRAVQSAYNEQRGITPQTIIKSVSEALMQTSAADGKTTKKRDRQPERELLSEWEIEDKIKDLTRAMGQAAEALDFERAARIRDEIKSLRDSRT